MRARIAAERRSDFDQVLAWRFGSANSLTRLLARRRQAWLSDREIAALDSWRDSDRRRAWLLARLTAKRLVRSIALGAGSAAGPDADRGPRLAEIEILAPRGIGRPQVWLRGARQPWNLSIAHFGASALVAVSQSERRAVGVDLTTRTAPSDAFVRLWCTPAERAWLAALPATRAAAALPLVWAAKEALYKACNQGEGFDPRRLEILPQQWRCYDRPLPPPAWRSWRNKTLLALLISLPATTSPSRCIDD